MWLIDLILRLFGIEVHDPAPKSPGSEPTFRTVSITIKGLREDSGVMLIPDTFDGGIAGERFGDHVSFLVSSEIAGGAWLRVSAQDFAYRLPDDVGIPLTDTELDAITIPSPELPKLVFLGRDVFTIKGKLFVWRGVTAFKLLELIATGQDSKARAFLQWAKNTGFNLVRVLAVLENSWFHLLRDRGIHFIPKLLDMCAEYGMYVELVALANTKDWSERELTEQVERVAIACEQRTNVVIEIANEPYHGSQSDWLNSAAFMQRLRTFVPLFIPVAMGSGPNDEIDSYPGGDYVTAHLSRGRDKWNMVRRVRELEGLSQRTGLYVVNDEPMGAAEVDIPGKRMNDPAVFFAFGVLGRIFNVGSTFHCEDGLYARVPGPVQQICARAFIRGTKVVPDAVRLTYKNTGWLDSPVDEWDDPDTVRVYSGLSGEVSIAVDLDADADDPGIEWKNGWRPSGIIDEVGNITVYRLTR